MATWLGQFEPAPEVNPAPTPAPAQSPEPGPEAGRFPSLHPPFDLEPHECPPPGEELDVEAVLANRRREEERKAEGRRDARRRKLDRLRA